MVKFKDLSGPFSVFQVLFKANLIFKDFSRQSCIFKYFSNLCEPWRMKILDTLFESILLCPSQQFFSYGGTGVPGLNQY